MTTSLYRRNAQIRLTISPGDVLNIDHSVDDNGRGIDFSFSCTRSLKRRLNECTVKIINLSDSTRSQLETAKRETQSAMELSAGYVGQKGERPLSGVIFRGEVSEINTTRNGPDHIIEIRAQDGLSAKRNKRANTVIPKGTGAGEAVKRLAEKGGLKVSGNLINSLGNQQLASDMSFSGMAFDSMEKLGRSFGFNISVQNGTVQADSIKATRVRNLSSPTTQNKDVYVLSYQSGLIQAPSRSKRGIVTAKCLMLYDLYPGHYVRFKDTEVDGYFRVRTTKYEGDTAGEAWFVTAECEEV